MIGILGFGAVGVSIGLFIVSTAITLYQYDKSTDRAAEAEKKNDLRMARQEAKAKLMSLKEYNRALGSYNRGIMIGKKELLEAKRERQAGLKSYGYGETAKS